jgi:hypothetical protein
MAPQVVSRYGAQPVGAQSTGAPEIGEAMAGALVAGTVGATVSTANALFSTTLATGPSVAGGFTSIGTSFAGFPSANVDGGGAIGGVESAEGGSNAGAGGAA